MAKINIGKIKRVPIREVWKKEARDFTSWLFNNLDILGEEININLVPIEQEKGVNPKRANSFKVDIIAENEIGQKVIIENQLTPTDHSHLGQIITYLSNLEAKIVIWISTSPKEEHEKAIEWLNECGSGVEFYLVKIEAYKIDDSKPAPKFTIVTEPSEQSEIIGEEKKELAGRHKKRLEFWQSLLNRSKTKTKLHSNITPGIYSYIGTGAGRFGLNYQYYITYKFGAIELYVDRGEGKREENKKIFDKLYSHKKEIEKIFGCKLEWQRLNDARCSRIRKTYNYAGLNDKDEWEKLQSDMINGMIKFEQSLKKYINNLKI